VLAAMSSEHLIDMIMTVPTVHLKPSMRDTGFTASYHFDPLTNLQVRPIAIERELSPSLSRL
jgi:hypothetical protein